MTPTEFKNKWLSQEDEGWSTFPANKVEQSNLSEQTKDFLKIGLPDSAAPYLSFEPITSGNFQTIYEYYDHEGLGEETKNYWIIGSDGAGDPICIDAANNDKIILLDHEQDFVLLDNMNTNISELASSLLIFRNFIKRINKKFGPNGFGDSLFTEKELSELQQELKALHPEYYVNGSFWDTQIEELRDEIS